MRLKILRNILFLLFLVLYAGIFRMQIIKGPEYFRQSENNRIRLVPEEASRGIIYDRNRIPLVENRLAFDVAAVPQEIEPENKDVLFLKLSKLINVTPEALADTFARNADAFFSPVLIAGNVPRETAFLVEQEMAQLSGVFIKPRAIRYYPFAKAAAHLVGYVGKMRENEYPQLKKYGYRIKDVIGRNGLERAFDDTLRGKPGGMQLEVDNTGHVVKVLSYRYPERGKDVYTVIDIKLQELLCGLIGNTKGAAGVMDADSGEILALYSGPSYDPNFFVDTGKADEVKKILRDSDAPLINRNLKTYPPGSIFKIVTAYTGLFENIITAQSTCDCTGEFIIGNSTRNCWLKSGHGEVNVKKALAVSCNVFFWDVGLKIGERILSASAKEFGFGKATGIELPGEDAGTVPNARWKNSVLRQRWYGGDTVNFSIGQGYLLVSPVQALKMAALVANGGHEVMPHIVKDEKRLKPGRNILSAEILRVVKKGMFAVVNSAEGTGRRAYLEGVDIYAKTGTAQVGGRPPHAWFVGFAEISNKKICFAVFLEHGGHGGDQAADIARQVIVYFKEH
ncbi:MAG: penicillin-binding protein 2 [Candidatus Omnitrophica bacterium]|nr:penicillin-binding protein 2 [Candidatus Omnitrophota bacterium]MCG2704123.1 penicillin-binding protein 2 [Candidatus Omnitrophota bacterium]